MPTFRICMINSHFKSADDAEFGSLEAARHAAVVTASRIVSEALADGERASAVEVQIFEGQNLVSRQVVTLSLADFTITQ